MRSTRRQAPSSDRARARRLPRQLAQAKMRLHLPVHAAVLAPPIEVAAQMRAQIVGAVLRLVHLALLEEHTGRRPAGCARRTA
jgi:hypothetical protein